MTNTSGSDPNFNIPFASSNVTLPSYNEQPRKKRTRISNEETGSSSSSKRVKRSDSDDSGIVYSCTECGKQFSLRKALYGHMRCHPERQWRGINPPPNHKRAINVTIPSSSSPLKVSVTSEEELDVASSLLLLASGGGSTGLSRIERRFECGGCTKVFGSHQALGRHRATHKHVKGCFAITNSTEHPPPPPPPPPQLPSEIVNEDKSKSVKLVSGMNHRCNICFKVFSSGQALGGHMRCHWEKDEQNQVISIDLNVPATTSADTSLDCSLDLRLGL